MSLHRMKAPSRHLSLGVAAGVTLLLGSGLTAGAQSADRSADMGANEAVLKDVNLVGSTLPIALRLIQQQTHIEYVLKPGDYGRVNVSISHKPVAEAMRIIAEAASADMWESNGVYFFGPHGSAPAAPVAPQIATTSVEAQGTKPVKLEKFYLKYTPPHRILRMLGLAGFNPLDSNDQFELAATRSLVEGLSSTYYHNLSNNNAVVLPYSSPAAPAATPVAAPVGPAAPTNNGGFNSSGNGNSGANSTGGGNLNGGMGAGDANLNGDQSARRDLNATQNFGRGQGGFGGGFGGAQGGGGFGQGGGAQGGPGGAGGTPAGQGAGAGFLQGISANDIFALDADNSLVLRYDDPQQILNLQEVLRVLDVKPRQIQIKAEFVTVTQNDVSSFGLNFNFTKVNLLAGANIGYQAANTAFIQYATGNLQTQLSFILTQGRGKVVASPLATTLNGVAAQFTSNQQIPILLSTAIIGNNGQSAVSTSLGSVTVSVNLFVTPRINGDDSITLQGRVVFGDVTGSITNPNGGSVPITIQQPVEINRIVRNGDSMVIAGLTRKRDNVSTNKVPLLGDLPLIGTLFRSRNVTTDDSELVVFITPTIIPDRPVGGTAGSGIGSGAGGGGAAGGLPPVGGGLMP